MNTTENTKEIEEELLVNDLEDMSYSVNNVSAKYCYVTHELRLHQNDRCKRFTLF